MYFFFFFFFFFFVKYFSPKGYVYVYVYAWTEIISSFFRIVKRAERDDDADFFFRIYSLWHYLPTALSQKEYNPLLF